MWPQYSMFFLFPAIVIILVFFILPFMNRRKEPFGFKSESVLPEDIYQKIKAVYMRKLFLFSVPLTIAVSIINMYILSTFLGSVMLGLFILGLAGINFMFYIQAYRAVRKALEESSGSSGPALPPEPEKEENEGKLPQW